MEGSTSDNEVTSEIPPTQHVTPLIKQEAAEHNCDENPGSFSKRSKDYCGNSDGSLIKVESNDAQACSADLNYEAHSTFSEVEEKGLISTKLSTSTTKPVINEGCQVGNEPWSVYLSSGSITPLSDVKEEQECKIEVEDHVLYKFKPEICQQEAYEEGSECCKHASPSDVGEASKPHADTFVDTCNIKVEYDTEDMVKQAGNEHGSQVEVFVCLRCNYSATEKDCLRRHMKRYHLGIEQRCSSNTKPDKKLFMNTKIRSFKGELYKCTTGLESQLIDHVTIKHNPHDLSKYMGTVHKKHVKVKHGANLKLYKCTFCKFATEYAHILSTHLYGKHDPDAPVFQCSKCNYTTKFKYQLSRHLRNDHDKYAPIYKCPHCDHVTKRKEYLIKHVQVKHDPNVKVYKCTTCNFTTKYAKYLTRHVTKKHTSDAPLYQCAHCTYRTQIKCNLQRHFSNVHDKQASIYKCPHCDHTTKHKNHLIEHTKVKHDPNAKVYKCTSCDYVTKRARCLKRHVSRKHTLDAPLYQCTKCSYTTQMKCNLSTHFRNIHDKHAPPIYKCPHCDHTTKRKKDLKGHVKRKHDLSAKVYECTNCNFATKHESYLKIHVARKHTSDAPL